MISRFWEMFVFAFELAAAVAGFICGVVLIMLAVGAALHYGPKLAWVWKRMLP